MLTQFNGGNGPAPENADQNHQHEAGEGQGCGIGFVREVHSIIRLSLETSGKVVLSTLVGEEGLHNLRLCESLGQHSKK